MSSLFLRLDSSSRIAPATSSKCRQPSTLLFLGKQSVQMIDVVRHRCGLTYSKSVEVQILDGVVANFFPLVFLQLQLCNCPNEKLFQLNLSISYFVVMAYTLLTMNSIVDHEVKHQEVPRKERWAIFVVSMRSVVCTWGCRKKGAVYVAMFNPLGMVIAVGMGVIFLGESLYLGSVIGAATIGIGFYLVLWAHAEESKVAKENKEKRDLVSSSADPLLSTKSIDVL
ncbi:hypothetical protein V8G54_014348 [Vigna mungo]|uniref:WAT1-related protein n=1 Tax=Vigna mungo TaxID=3915 RepID=A0AAQ3NKG3_VIGMU